MKIKILFSTFLGFILVASSIFSQTFKLHESPGSGSFANDMNAVHYDVNSNMAWVGVGTNEGSLKQFDGCQWTTYNEAYNGAPLNYIKDIEIDQNGNLWAAGSGLFYISNSQVFHFNTGNSGIPSNFLNCVEIGTNALFIGASTLHGLTSFDGVNWKLDSEWPDGPWVEEIEDIVIDKENQIIWIAGHNKLRKLKDNTVEIFDATNAPIPEQITNLALDSKNNLWMSFEDEGIGMFDGTEWTNFNAENSGLTENNIQDIFIDQQDHVWIATRNNLTYYNYMDWQVFNQSNTGTSAVERIAEFSQGLNSIVWAATSSGLLEIDLTTSSLENLPEAKVCVIQSNICGDLYQFSDASSSSPNSWSWNFGDGNTSTDQSPNHVYENSGVYEVTFIACNDIGCDTTKINSVEVNINCKTSLMPTGGTIKISEDCSGLLYDDGGPLSDYSDEGIFTIQPIGATSVTITFNEFETDIFHDLLIYDGANINAPLIGTYNRDELKDLSITSTGGALTLRFDNSSFSSSSDIGFEAEWTCSKSAPNPNFTSTLNFPCKGMINFNDSSNGATSWEWNFGDGNSSIEQSPIHNYESAGSYNVTLTACNDLGCNELTQVVEVKIGDLDCNFFLMPNASEPLITNSCEGQLFDTGDEDGDYSNNVNGIFVIQPTNATNIELTFQSFFLESNYDYLNIYDGEDRNASLIGRFTGSNLPNGGIITSSGGAITILFETDESEVRPGFELTWTCESTTTSLQELPINQELLQVYPNPTSGLVHLRYEGQDNHQLQLTVYNSLGQRVLQKSYIHQSNILEPIDLTGLNSGVWLVEVWDKDTNHIFREKVVNR